MPLNNAISFGLQGRVVIVTGAANGNGLYTLLASQCPQANAHRTRGEFVLLVHPQAADKADTGTLDAATQRTLDVLLAELPLKTAVKLCADITGQPRNTLYETALAQRKSRQAEED